MPSRLLHLPKIAIFLAGIITAAARAQGPQCPHDADDSVCPEKKEQQEACEKEESEKPPGKSKPHGIAGGISTLPSKATTQSAFDGEGSVVNHEGASQLTHHAHRFRTASGSWSSLARSELQLADAINSTVSQINSYTQARSASESPQAASQIQSYLSQPPQAPGGMEQKFQNLGMQTNQDVLDKGPQFANNLTQASTYHDAQAQRLDTQAMQADAAAAKMQGISNTLVERGGNLQSASVSSVANNPNQAVDSSLVLGNNSSAFAAATAPLSGSVLGDSASGIASSASASGSGLSHQGQPATSSPGADGRGGRVPSSLSAHIRAALAERKAQPSEATPQSKFDNLFEHQERSPAAKREEAAPNAGQAQAAPAFSLSGSETDRAIGHLVGEHQGANEEQIFGSVDQTIFARMKKYLTQAQAEKKIGR